LLKSLIILHGRQAQETLVNIIVKAALQWYYTSGKSLLVYLKAVLLDSSNICNLTQYTLVLQSEFG
jgi:hypothetical protein